MSALKSVIAVILAAAGLSACAGLGGTFSIDRFLNKEITGDTAGACMARSYQSWARNKAWVQRNYAGAVELAERAGSIQFASDLVSHHCAAPSDASFQARTSLYMKIASNDAARACACGNALVELARWSCAGPADDKAALKARFDKAAAACEGR